MERKVGIILAMTPQFGRELKRSNWENPTSYPTPANIAVVKEFYTNSWAFGSERQTYTSYVRGRRIPYDAATVNRFLGTEWSGE